VFITPLHTAHERSHLTLIVPDLKIDRVSVIVGLNFDVAVLIVPVPGFENIKIHFLATGDKEVTNVFAEYLDVIDVRVVPIVVNNIEEMHECVVFGIGESEPDLDCNLIFLFMIKLEINR
jgi:hypothetical protein